MRSVPARPSLRARVGVALLAAVLVAVGSAWSAGSPRPDGMRQRLAPLFSVASKPSGGRAKGVLGRSANGRVIRVKAWGASAHGAARSPSVLVVGCIHGDECAGRRVVNRIVDSHLAPTTVWAIPNLNPDGYRAGTRLNGRGVDLNRNFPHAWRPIGRRYDPEYSGPHPFSEPETRLAAHLIRLVHPTITIWFHQEADPLVRAWGQSVPAARRYAKLAGLRFRHLHWLAGTAPNWQNHHFQGTSAFVVELPSGPVTGARAAELGHAIFRLTRLALPQDLRSG